jgi:hypothetical protein
MYSRETCVLEPKLTVCTHLPHPTTVEVAAVGLPTGGYGLLVSACEPPVDLCAGAIVLLQPVSHTQEALGHQADVQTPQVLSQVSAWLASAHTLPEEMHFPPPIHCNIISTKVLFSVKDENNEISPF